MHNLIYVLMHKIYKHFAFKNTLKMSRRWRRRRGSRGRPPKPIRLSGDPRSSTFIPIPKSRGDPIHIDLAELETLKLVDLEGLSQEEAGLRMETSRGTVWRLLHSARKKTAHALTENRPLQVED